MNKLSCCIVEDDAMSLKVIAALAERTGCLDILGKFTNANEAMAWLLRNEVDLVFLDVEMPGMTGIELLKTLPYTFQVIIVSANPDYAIDAFELSVTDYLLKPVKDYPRFLAAVTKVMNKVRSRPAENAEENIFVKIDSLLLKLDLQSVLWIEAFGDYVKINTPEKVFTVYSTLTNILQKLPADKFIRVHRSFIVNLSKISNIDPNNLEINKRIIPVSQTYRDELLRRIKVV